MPDKLCSNLQSCQVIEFEVDQNIRGPNASTYTSTYTILYSHDSS